MANKYQLITGLYLKTGREITRNPRIWQKLLASACYNYKCHFDEQLLIFAQRPDATAVLTLEDWNKKFNRRIHKYSKGIAVIDVRDQNSLKHYFDISDTYERNPARAVPIWKMDAQYEKAVIDSLSAQLGDILGDKESTHLPNALLHSAANIVDDHLLDYLTELKNNIEGSFLGELDDLNIEATYKQLVTNSVAYMLLVRLDIDADVYFDIEDFSDIAQFNTPVVLKAVGVATSDLSEMVLKEIRHAIRNVQIDEKNQITDQRRTFDKQQQSVYDNGKPPPERRDKQNEGNHIQSGGRVPLSRPRITPTARSSPWQIRHDERELSAETQADHLLEPVDQFHTESTSSRDRTTGVRTDRTADQADGKTRGSDRKIESDRPDEVGRLDEQHQAKSGGNRHKRPDLRLDTTKGRRQQLSLFEQDKPHRKFYTINAEYARA